MQAITTSLLVVCAALAAQAGLLPALPSISDLWPAHSDKVPDLGNPRWGNAPDNDIIEPFKIEYSEEKLTKLRHRLSEMNLTPSLASTDFHYGVQSETAKEMINFWSNQYNYTERLEFLNQYPQSKTNVDGLSLHYIHIKPDPTLSKNKQVVPIMMLHGFPGSVREFYGIIENIKKREEKLDFALEIIIPSLPGFGFSQGADRPGFGAAQIAVVLKNLMLKLGLNKFIIHGGDWGARIATLMSTLFPENIKGFHSNFCVALTKKSIELMLAGTVTPRLIVSKELEDRIYPLKDHLLYGLQETGFFHEQLTKPDTIGIALKDSPGGLCAWILEKFTGLTDPAMLDCKDGCLKEKFGWISLLDNLLYYHIPESIGTAIRIYKESFTSEQFALNLDSIPSQVPSACVGYKHESLFMTKQMVQTKFPKLLHYEVKNTGGHFAAFEVPDIFTDDLIEAVTKLIDSKQNYFPNQPISLPNDFKISKIIGDFINKLF